MPLSQFPFQNERIVLCSINVLTLGKRSIIAPGLGINILNWRPGHKPYVKKSTLECYLY